MSYVPSTVLPANTLLGNPNSSSAPNQAITLDSTLSISGGVLNALPPQSISTTGNTTINNSYNGATLISTDSGAVTLTLPTGILAGFRCHSCQGGTGVITYAAGSGATIVNGSHTSKGAVTLGYRAIVENLGNDTWIITGDYI